MPQLSKALVQPYRSNMLMIGAGWRAAFAPFDYVAYGLNANGGPSIVDLQAQGPFDSNNLPTNFVDLGWINQFKETSQEKIGSIYSGYLGAVRRKIRTQIGDEFEFHFREFGRLQYKIASGAQVFNLLKATTPSTTGPLSSAGPVAVAVGASGYVASGAVAGFVGQPTLYVPSGSGASFPANSYIVCDVDYVSGTQGLIGSNGYNVIATGVTDVDLVRKTSDFVALVAAVVPNAATSQDALILSQPFVGGGSPIATAGKPASTAKVQPIVGWTARQGGAFIQDWSGLFIADTIDGSQFCIYVPHLSINANKSIGEWKVENAGTTDNTGYDWDCAFDAMAFDDPLDGNTICAYSMLYPNKRVMATY
ncbi:MAG: hypothetical protein KGL39_13610 [Patescibacteria group bacterium]|nr:hypothetical protein [Patescibacteria group bacterium]